MLHPKVQLRLQDITKAPGNSYNKIQTQILTFLIIEAIKNTYLNKVAVVFRNKLDYKYPQMLVVDILPPAR